MKKIIICFVALLGLAGCSDQLTEGELANAVQPMNRVDDEYYCYLEKARWGDAGAYVKLADCYRNGVVVKSDFIGMTAMLAMAEQYDKTLRLQDYVKALPEDDSYRLIFETMDEIGRKNHDKTKDVAAVLIANGKPEGYVINGAMQVEAGDIPSVVLNPYVTVQNKEARSVNLYYASHQHYWVIIRDRIMRKS